MSETTNAKPNILLEKLLAVSHNGHGESFERDEEERADIAGIKRSIVVALTKNNPDWTEQKLAQFILKHQEFFFSDDVPKDPITIIEEISESLGEAVEEIEEAIEKEREENTKKDDPEKVKETKLKRLSLNLDKAARALLWQIKSLALLLSAGEEGKSILESLGFTENTELIKLITDLSSREDNDQDEKLKQDIKDALENGLINNLKLVIDSPDELHPSGYFTPETLAKADQLVLHEVKLAKWLEEVLLPEIFTGSFTQYPKVFSTSGAGGLLDLETGKENNYLDHYARVLSAVLSRSYITERPKNKNFRDQFQAIFVPRSTADELGPYLAQEEQRQKYIEKIEEFLKSFLTYSVDRPEEVDLKNRYYVFHSFIHTIKKWLIHRREENGESLIDQHDELLYLTILVGFLKNPIEKNLNINVEDNIFNIKPGDLSEESEFDYLAEFNGLIQEVFRKYHSFYNEATKQADNEDNSIKATEELKSKYTFFELEIAKLLKLWGEIEHHMPFDTRIISAPSLRIKAPNSNLTRKTA